MKNIIIFVAIAFSFVLSTVYAGGGGYEFEYLGKFSSKKIPFISDKDKKGIGNYYKYLSQKEKKEVVLAVAEDGSIGFNLTGNIEDNLRSSLQTCEHIAQTTCGIAVYKGKLVKYKPFPRQLQYAEEFDIELIPFISTKDRAKLKEWFEEETKWTKVIALSRNGRIGTSRDEEDVALKKALERCNKAYKKKRCFLYSINDKLFFDPSTNIIPDRTK